MSETFFDTITPISNPLTLILPFSIEHKTVHQHQNKLGENILPNVKFCCNNIQFLSVVGFVCWFHLINCMSINVVGNSWLVASVCWSGGEHCFICYNNRPSNKSPMQLKQISLMFLQQVSFCLQPWSRSMTNPFSFTQRFSIMDYPKGVNIWGKQFTCFL